MGDAVPMALRARWFSKSARQSPTSRDEEAQATGGGNAVRCARCGHAITRADARVQIDGVDEHSRINPGGWIHRFTCWREAPGCKRVGAPSTEASWFVGHAWEVAVCGACNLHLGWYFACDTRGFFGLLCDHVTERDASGS